MDDPQIKDYRQPWESDEHWTLRKEFIERFWDDFPEDRLLCLAQVYSNVELLGCSYPAPVMRQIRELSKDLQECGELRNKRKERAAVQFVKEKQKAPKNSWNTSGAFSQKRSSSETSGSCSQANNPASCGTPSKKFKESDSKSLAHSSSKNFTNPLKDGKNSDFNKKEQCLPSENLCQKHPASNINTEQNTSKGIVKNSDTTTLETSNEIIVQTDELPKSLKANFADILLFIRKSLAKQLTPVEILNTMTQKFHIKLDYDFKLLPRAPSPTHECSVKIDDVFISKAEELTKKMARSKAAKLVIDLLMKTSTSVGNLNSSNVDKSRISSDSRTLTEQVCVRPLTHSVPHSMNEMDWCRNTSTSSSSNIPNSAKYTGTHENRNLLFNQKNSSILLNQVVKSSGYQSTSSTPVSRVYDSAMKQNARCISPAGQRNRKGHKNSRCSDLSPEFLVILDNSDITKSDTAISVFTSSANFNHVPFQFEYEKCISGSQDMVRAQIFLNGDAFCSAVNENKQMAKEDVAKAALDILRKTAYTVKVKDEHDGGFTVSRNQVFDTADSNNSITESNIGCKMLKMMGWSGGGIGKTGSKGIEEPVKAVEKHKFGQGLGYTKKGNSEVSFRARIEQLLQDYARSDSTSDLIFSTEFSKEERKEIHQVACKYGLKNNSKGGKGDGRHLIVSKRYTAQQLINRLRESGGRTHKYELIPPTG